MSDALPEESTTSDARERWRLAFEANRWRTAESAPRDGSHILVCHGAFASSWTFAQYPPCVVHWWSNPGEEGFYLRELSP